MIIEFLYASLFALFTHNLLFNGGFGISEAIRIATKPKDFLPLAFLVTFFTSVTAAACCFLDKIPRINALTSAYHLIVYCLVLAVIYFIFTGIMTIFYKKGDKSDLHRIGMAAVNTLVLAVPIINRRAAFGPVSAIGLGLGAGCAFFLGVMMIGAAQNKLSENNTIYRDFKGKPALFLYIALIALGLEGLSGHSLFL